MDREPVDGYQIFVIYTSIQNRIAGGGLRECPYGNDSWLKVLLSRLWLGHQYCHTATATVQEVTA